MSQQSISQKLAQLQLRIAGLPTEEITSLAHEQAHKIIARNGHDADAMSRIMEQALRDATSMPTEELSVFTAALHQELHRTQRGDTYTPTLAHQADTVLCTHGNARTREACRPCLEAEMDSLSYAAWR